MKFTLTGVPATEIPAPIVILQKVRREVHIIDVPDDFLDTPEGHQLFHMYWHGCFSNYVEGLPPNPDTVRNATFDELVALNETLDWDNEDCLNEWIDKCETFMEAHPNHYDISDYFTSEPNPTYEGYIN